mgnify:CR=1 FL=1
MKASPNLQVIYVEKWREVVFIGNSHQWRKQKQHYMMKNDIHKQYEHVILIQLSKIKKINRETKRNKDKGTNIETVHIIQNMVTHITMN